MDTADGISGRIQRHLHALCKIVQVAIQLTGEGVLRNSMQLLMMQVFRSPYLCVLEMYPTTKQYPTLERVIQRPSRRADKEYDSKEV